MESWILSLRAFLHFRLWTMIRLCATSDTIRYAPRHWNKYMHLLTMHVGKRISALLPDKFALFFDGWSAGIDHYVAIFATYPSSNAKGFQSILLAFISHMWLSSTFHWNHTRNVSIMESFRVCNLHLHFKCFSIS